MKDFRENEKYFTCIREKLEYGVYHVVQELHIEAYVSKDPLPFERRQEGKCLLLKPGDHWGNLFDCGWFHFRGRIPEQVRNQHVAVLIDVSAEGLLVDEEGNPVQGLTSATSRNEFPLGLWGKRRIEIADCAKDGRNIDCWIDFTCCDVEGQYRNDGRVKEACIAVIDDLCRDAFYDWVVCQSLYVGLCENGDAYGEAVGEILWEAAELLGTKEMDAGGADSHEGADGGSTDLGVGADTEQLRKMRDAYAKDVMGLDASQERISIWPDPETNHTLKYQQALDAGALRRVREILGKILKEKNTAPAMTYSAIGHSHLDLLFLWPERETYRKCARTLSTVLKMMDSFPEYKFCLSQAPVYQWMKEKYPVLYRKLKQRIQEKRIEVVGAFYIECDTNLPSGESLVRQLLYGKRFFREEFGLDMRVGFLPDVFGYSAALPQLFVKSGVPYFTTNKLSMNDTNRFPRYTFWWYGLDGSRVLTHMLPENSYTSAAVPQMAIYGEYHNTDKDLCPEGLQLYGLGDGGGGPSYEHMERRKRSRDLKGCPPFHDEFVVDFFDRIAKGSERYRQWHGELYFERHQGTYTSIAKQKLWNRRLEEALHTLEWLAVEAEVRLSIPYPKEWLKECWQDVILYQFHDCLPGSAIERVYQETQARYRQLYQRAVEEIEKRKAALASCLDLSEMKEPVVLFNPISFQREERIEINGKEIMVSLAPYEIRAIDISEVEGISAKREVISEKQETISEKQEIGEKERADWILENVWVRVVFSGQGTVTSLFDKKNGRELLPAGKEGNQLNLYPDELTHWDIEKDYLTKTPQRAKLVEIKKNTAGSCQKIHFVYELGEKSHITQTASLEERIARVDFKTTVDWQEEYQMLRVAWPVDVVAREAQCEIQFGHIGRPTHHNTSWDEAKFEVCAHRWVDMADADGGLALLNDCKYGYKIWDNVLDLCLLRSQNCPCEQGDIGVHEFTYSVYPHSAGVWEGGVIRQGYQLNYPLEIWQPGREATPLQEACTQAQCLEQKECLGQKPEQKVKQWHPDSEKLKFLEMDSASVVLESIKKAEDGDGYVLRLYEARGGRAKAKLRLHGFEAVGICNLLEETLPEDASFRKTDNGAEITFHAFEVQSLFIRGTHKSCEGTREEIS